MTRKRKTVIAVLLIITLLWTAFIFSRSMKTASVSAGESGRLTALLQALLGGFPISEHLIRKLAHFGEYLILVLPLTGAAILMMRKWLPAAAWGYAVVVAACDEFIVQAISGRGSRFSDMLIDSAGALVGVIAMICLTAAYRWYCRRQDQ